jgi:hypothetical protein
MGKSTPDFLIIGAQKSGTSSLYSALTKHSAIDRSVVKEINFFSQYYDKGLNWYHSFFPKNNKLHGEASPIYLFDKKVPKRVYTHYPNIKCIVILRDPISRAYSHYYHNLRKQKNLNVKREERTFEIAVQDELQSLKLGQEISSMISYVSRGFYVDQIEHWLKYFPKEQFLFLKSDDFFRDQQAVLDACFKFLGVSTEHITYTEQNIGDKKPPMDPEIHALLQEVFAPYNERLVVLLGEQFRW